MTQLQLARFEKWWEDNAFLDSNMHRYITKDRAKELYERGIAPEIEWHPAEEKPTNGSYLVLIKGTRDVEYTYVAVTSYTSGWTLLAGESVIKWAECPKIPEGVL